MRKELIIVLRDFLITQMNHWCLFLVPITLFSIINAEAVSMWKWALCSIVPFAFFLVRKFTDRFLIFVGSHLLVFPAFLYLMPKPLLEKVILLIFVGGYAVFSFYLRVMSRDRLDRPIKPIVIVVGAAAGLFVEEHFGVGDWEKYYRLPVVAFIGLYFIQLYLQNYQYFVKVNDSAKGHIQQRVMFRSGMKLILSFSLVVMGFASLTGGSGWVSRLLALPGKVFRLLFQLVDRLLTGQLEQGIPDWERPGYVYNDFDQLGEGEAGAFWVFLERVFMAAFAVCLIVFIIFAIYKLVITLHKWFSQRSDRSVEREEEDNLGDVREKCETDKRKKERKSPFAFLSVRERIRRVYKKDVWARRNFIVKEGDTRALSLMTAKETGDKLERPALAESYEKARYSNEECTAEDLRRAKVK